MTKGWELKEVLAVLEGVKPYKNRWMAKCPCHDDRKQSLSIKVGKNGRAVWHCHAGCERSVVLAALRARLGEAAPLHSHRGDAASSTEYSYTDEKGKVLYQNVRFVPKDFRMRAPTGSGGWTWRLNGARRVLYNLPQVNTAVAEGQRIFFVEGEKDAESLRAAGLVATTIAGGANAPLPEDICETLGAAEVVILPDNDTAGEQFAIRVATTLAPVARVRIVKLPDLPDKGDVTDWLCSGGTYAELESLIGGTPFQTHEHAASSEASTVLRNANISAVDEQDERAPSQAEVLVRLALDIFNLGVSLEGDPFAIEKGGPNIARMLRGNRDSLRTLLACHYRRAEGRVPTSSALTDALNVLEGEAMAKEQEPVALRVAAVNDTIVVDIGDRSGRVVIVSKDGWRIERDSPVPFRRTALTGSLPLPVPGGDLSELRRLLNIAEDSWVLLVGWIVAALFPGIPHPVLMFGGEQGTGKSTAARLLLRIVDPSPAPLRSEPRDPESWAMCAAGSWGICIDNVSRIPAWFSDVLCKTVTGDGWVKRRLYSDSDLCVVAYRRCVMLTSIDAGALRGDLADRLVLVDLDRIPSERRRTETELNEQFADAAPRLFGALLDAVGAVLRSLELIQLDALPRMADFARVLAALDLGQPEITGGTAFRTYLAQATRLAEEVVDSDPLASAIVELVATQTWEGTSGDLLARLTPERPPKFWPTSPRALSSQLLRLIPSLREAGVSVFVPNVRSSRGRVIVLSSATENYPAPEFTTPEQEEYFNSSDEDLPW